MFVAWDLMALVYPGCKRRDDVKDIYLRPEPHAEPSLSLSMISLVYYTFLPWRSADWRCQKLEGPGYCLQGNQVGTAVVAQAIYL